jgi:predicted choloylglycine hydrolase
MNILEFTGTPRDFGTQNGTILKGLFNAPPASEAKRKFTSECIPHIMEHTPGIIDETDALAETIGEDIELMRCFLLTLGLEPRCTVFALAGHKNLEDSPIFARNYDWDPSSLQYFDLVKAKPQGKYANLGFSDVMVGRYGGVNEKGLACAITAEPAYMGKPKPGVRMNLAVRWMLDNLSSTDEAVEWLTKVPHQYAHNYLIADKTGDLTRIESSPLRDKVTTASDFIHVTNHYIDEEMRELENPDFNYSNTHTRYDTVDKWYYEKDCIDVADVQDVLSSHENGVCNHGEGFETIWSWIALLGERYAYVCNGSPCKGTYQKIEF